MQEKVKLSIIIPVYNVEKYIEKCLNSILSQKGEFEIIAVDDGSKDTSLQIMQDIAKSDKRLKVFHKENEGVSMARNFGVENASGEFISFVDSDDFVSANYIASLFNFMGLDKDLVIFDCIRVDKKCSFREYVLEDKIYTNPLVDSIECFADFSFTFGSPINKLYNAEIIKQNKLKFKKSLKICEDMLFNFEYFKQIKNFQIVHSTLYNYVTNEESVTAKRKIEYISNNDVIYKEFKKEIKNIFDKQKKDEVTDILMNRFLQRAMYEINNLPRQGVKLKHIRQEFAKTTYAKDILEYNFKGFFNKFYKRQLKYVMKGNFLFYKISKINLFAFKVLAKLKEETKRVLRRGK